METSLTTHRELRLPNPLEMPLDRPAVPPPLIIEQPHTSWLEVHRDAEGTIRHYLGAKGTSEVNHTYSCLNAVFPGLELGPPAICPLRSLRPQSPENTRLFRAVQSHARHYRPKRPLEWTDSADLLLRSLTAEKLSGHEVVLQILFRRARYWERGFLVGRYNNFLESMVHGPDRKLLPELVSIPVGAGRVVEPTYHVEIRAAVQGPEATWASLPLLEWIRSWTSANGDRWWVTVNPSERDRSKFMRTLLDHDIFRFASRKCQRDFSGTDVSWILPVPWRDDFHGFSDAGSAEYSSLSSSSSSL